MEQLLATKLFIPLPRLNLVSRPRLFNRLQTGLHRKLTLISAPVGFGKTTLLSEWVHCLRSSSKPQDNQIAFAWLSLDENDNDLSRFLTYLISAINQADGLEHRYGENALDLVLSSQQPAVEQILVALINNLAELPKKLVLVLDDYHLISNSSVDKAINYLLENLPPQFHLIIATREDPHLPIARLRVRSHLTELRAADLRFTPSEGEHFLTKVMELNLSKEEIDALETRTEGWIAGLQLAALSMQGHEDPSILIKSFSGSHRLVLDYFIEEVLEQQPEEIVQFLLFTSILKRLTGSLCDSLTGREDGQETIEILEHENLFIIPLDSHRQWYRYHHLFADLLAQRLRIGHPEMVSDLHTKAAQWYEDHDNLFEAIQHAFESKDISLAVRLINKGAKNALEQSELKSVHRWVERLPSSALKNSPWLFIYYCWASALAGQVDTVSSHLKDTQWLLDSVAHQGDAAVQLMTGLLIGVNAVVTNWKREFPKCYQLAEQAKEYIPKDHWARGYCMSIIGSRSWADGNLSNGHEAYSAAYTIGKATGNILLEVSSICNLAHVIEHEGYIHRSAEMFRSAFPMARQANKELPVAAYIYIDLARLLYEFNHLEKAGEYLEKGMNLCQRFGDGRAEKIGFSIQAQWQIANRQYEQAAKSIKQSEQADPSPGTPFDMRGGEYQNIYLWLKRKEFTRLATWLDESENDIDRIAHVKAKMLYTVHARVMIALGCEYQDDKYLIRASKLIDKLLNLAEQFGWGKKLIEILVLQALNLQALGETERALQVLDRAVYQAEPEGYVRTFVDEGAPMLRLLSQLKTDDIRIKKYIQTLQNAILEEEPIPSESQGEVVEMQGLVDPLSKREIEILMLIAAGLTNQEIGSKLFLALNTVKTHIRNIYSKLGVHNRVSAISIARDLKLIPDE